KHAKRVVRGKETVLDRRASTLGDRPNRVISIRVDDGANVRLLCFITSRRNLLITQRLTTTVRYTAGRGKHLDHVRAIGNDLSDELASFVETHLGIIDGSNRRKDARSRQNAAQDRLAQVLINRTADTLHRGKSGAQRHPGVLDGVSESR